MSVAPKRVGVVALLHESNTFIADATDLARFRQDVLLTGTAVRDHFADAPHEVGGFFRRSRRSGHRGGLAVCRSLVSLRHDRGRGV